jgi:hypothetical protein
MARKKLGLVEQAIRDAAKELSLPRDDWRVERLGTLQILLKVTRHKWAADQTSARAADIVMLMDEITKLRTEAGIDNTPSEVEIKFVEHYTGVATITCPHCQMSSRHEVSNRPFESATPTAPSAPEVKATTSHDNAIAGPSSADPSPAEPKPAAPVMEVSYLENFSASAFHSQCINGREIAPLKRLQPDPYAARNTSPMSQ